MMKDGDIEIRICSDLSSYEQLTAELYYKDTFLAMLSHEEEKGQFQIHFFPSETEFKMPLNAFSRALEMAQEELAR